METLNGIDLNSCNTYSQVNIRWYCLEDNKLTKLSYFLSEAHFSSLKP